MLLREEMPHDRSEFPSNISENADKSSPLRCFVVLINIFRRGG